MKMAPTITSRHSARMTSAATARPYLRLPNLPGRRSATVTIILLFAFFLLSVCADSAVAKRKTPTDKAVVASSVADVFIDARHDNQPDRAASLAPLTVREARKDAVARAAFVERERSLFRAHQQRVVELADSSASLEAEQRPTSSSSSSFSSEDSDSSSSSSSSSFPPPPPPTSTTTTPPTTPRPSRRRAAAHLGLLGLLALLVLVVIGGFVAWCLWRRNRNRRRVRRLRLNGTRRPGEVDDVDMGQAVKGGDWLNLDTTDGTSHVVGGAAAAGRRSRFTAGADASFGARGSGLNDAAVDGFDPIGQQAAEGRQRRRARRVAVAAAEGGGGGAGAGGRLGGAAASVFGANAPSGSKDAGADDFSDTWSSDEDGESEGGPGGMKGGLAGGGIGAAGPIYATSMVPPTTAAAGAAGADGAGTGAATTVVPPLSLNPQYFNETTKVLLDRYNTEADFAAGYGNTSSGGYGNGGGGTAGGGGKAGAASAAATLPAAQASMMAGARGGGGAASENTAFEHILASAAAPLRVGQEFHQRGGGDSVDRAGSAPAAAGAAAGAPALAGHDSDEEYEEEEEEEEEEDTNANDGADRRGNTRHADPSAFRDAEPTDEEEEEEEEEEQEEDRAPPARGHPAVSPYNGAGYRSLR